MHDGFHQRFNICCVNVQDHLFYVITTHSMGEELEDICTEQMQVKVLLLTVESRIYVLVCKMLMHLYS